MISVISLFVVFSDEDMVDYDHTGIVYDIRESTNGYTFTIETGDGTRFRCYCADEPRQLGYYAVEGTMSEDGNIFFVSRMKDLDVVDWILRWVRRIHRKDSYILYT